MPNFPTCPVCNSSDILIDELLLQDKNAQAENYYGIPFQEVFVGNIVGKAVYCKGCGIRRLYSYEDNSFNQ